MICHSEKRTQITGKAKPVELKFGAYLRFDTCPCWRDCQERQEGCHGICKRYKKWRFFHGLALEEQRQVMRSRKEATQEHQHAMDRALRGNNRRKRR